MKVENRVRGREKGEKKKKKRGACVVGKERVMGEKGKGVVLGWNTWKNNGEN